MCKAWQEGDCKFGETCTFAHGLEDIRSKKQNTLYLQKENSKKDSLTESDDDFSRGIQSTLSSSSDYARESRLDHCDFVEYYGDRQKEIDAEQLLISLGYNRSSFP